MRIFALTAVVVSLVMASIGFLGFMTSALFLVLVTESEVSPPKCSAVCDGVADVALEAYQVAAEDAPCDIDWTVLAGIGQIESRQGTIYGGAFDGAGTLRPPLFGPELDGSGVGGNVTPMPAGKWAGQYGLGEWMRAVGPMQFLPSTWEIYGAGGDPQNIFDAAHAAAALLCDAGAEDDVKDAVFAYNHSWDYVTKVLYWAAVYAQYGGEESHEDVELLDDEGVCLSPQAAEDLRDGIIDPRLVVFMEEMAKRWEYCVSILRTGHAACVVNTGIFPNCSVSNHWHGRAVDISAVSQALVRPDNSAARDVVDWIATNQHEVWMPESVGSPWPDAFGFTDSYHQDHLHIAFHTDGVGGPVGVEDRPPDRPPRPDETRSVSFELVSGSWDDAATAADFVGVWDESLPSATSGVSGLEVGEKWTPDILYTSPEYEHPEDWRRQSRDRPDEVLGGAPESGGADQAAATPHSGFDLTAEGTGGDQIGAASDGVVDFGVEDHSQHSHDVEVDAVEIGDLQALIDAVPAGGVLRLEAKKYSGAIVTKPLHIIGPQAGTAVIVEGSTEVAALSVVGAGTVTVEGVRIEGGRWSIFSQGSDLRVVDVVATGSTEAAVTVRGGTGSIVGSTVTNAGAGVEFWSTVVSVLDTTISGVGGAGVDAVTSQVTIRDSAITSTGGPVLTGQLSARVVAERNFFGAGGGGVEAFTATEIYLRRNAIWSTGPWAINEDPLAFVVEYSNVVVDGAVRASWSAPGPTGDAGRAVLGAPWIDANGRPTPTARAALAGVADTRPEPAAVVDNSGSVVVEAPWPPWPG